MSTFTPQVSIRPLGHGIVEVRLGHDLLDDYLRFVAARCRPNSVLAAGYDLKVFFTAVPKEPVQVTMADVFEFIAAQRLPVRGGNVIRLEDREAGLSARTIRRRLATLSGLYGYLAARNLTTKNPVPTGLSVRRPADQRSRTRSTPLIRPPGHCPESWTQPMPQYFWLPPERPGTARCFWRCCWAGCAAAKSWAYNWPTSMSPTRR
jgi:integrase/recombinase XerD